MWPWELHKGFLRQVGRSAEQEENDKPRGTEQVPQANKEIKYAKKLQLDELFFSHPPEQPRRGA